MATHVLLNPAIHWHKHRMIGVCNSVTLSHSAEEKDDTTFSNAGFRTRQAGLLVASAELSGFADWAAPADQVPTQTLITRMGQKHPITFADADDEGEEAWLHEGLLTSADWFGQVGEMDPASASLMGTGPLVEGVVLHPGDTARTTTASTTGVQQGSVSASQSAYAVLHVTSNTGGGTLDVIVESDDNSGFTTPTTRFTFTQATGATSEWLTPVAGAISDDWWRVTYTIASGTWQFLVGFGIR